jgi:hypothetical protein
MEQKINKISTYNWWRPLLSLLVIIAPGFYFGLVGKSAEMGLAIVAGAISAAFLNIDRIQRFKGAGFEAEMREGALRNE